MGGHPENYSTNFQSWEVYNHRVGIRAKGENTYKTVSHWREAGRIGLGDWT